MRIVFFGTSSFAIPAFRELLNSSHTVSALVTQPDRKTGRRLKVSPPLTKVLALAHNIPVYSPGLTDGSLGDQLFFFSQKHPDFRLDIVEDLRRFHQLVIDAETVGVLILGGGLPKAHINNATMMRGGADYAVYLSTGMAGDGSYAGAPPSEAISWGKLKAEGRSALVQGDATLTFPLLVAGALRHDITIP